MASTIKTKNSNVAGKTPLPADLEIGELAVNLADHKLFSKEPGGTVVELGPPGDILSNPPAGTSQTITSAAVADTALTVVPATGATAPALINEGTTRLESLTPVAGVDYTQNLFADANGNVAGFAPIATNTTWNVPADGTFEELVVRGLRRGVDPGVTLTIQTVDGPYKVIFPNTLIVGPSGIFDPTSLLNTSNLKQPGFHVVDSNNALSIATGSNPTDGWRDVADGRVKIKCVNQVDLLQAIPLANQTAGVEVNLTIKLDNTADIFTADWGDGTIVPNIASGTEIKHTYAAAFTGTVRILGCA